MHIFWKLYCLFLKSFERREYSVKRFCTVWRNCDGKLVFIYANIQMYQAVFNSYSSREYFTKELFYVDL